MVFKKFLTWTAKLRASEKYDQVPQHEDELASGLTKASTKKAGSSILIPFAVLLIVLLGNSLALIIHMLDNSRFNPDGSYGVLPTQDEKAFAMHSCGTSPADARKAGCQFDLLTSSWVPPACFDREMTLEFLEEGRKRYIGGWYVYLDKSGKRPENGTFDHNDAIRVTLESLADGDFEGKIWSTNLYHQYHCVYSWMKVQKAYLNRAGARKTMVDDTISGPHHNHHCRDMIFKPIGREESVTGWQEVFYRTCI